MRQCPNMPNFFSRRRSAKGSVSESRAFDLRVIRNILRIVLERHCNKRITSVRLKHNMYQKEVFKERQKEAGGIIVGKWAQRAKMTKEKWERDSQKRDIFIGFDELTVGSG